MVRATIVVAILALGLALGIAGSFAVTMPPQAKGTPNEASSNGRSASEHGATLPMQACNNGTARAHEAMPPTLPNGNVTPGHMHVPMMLGGGCTRMG